MELNYIGIGIMIAGCLMILFREKLARYFTEFQNNNFGFNFGKRITRINSWLNSFVGSLFIVCGLIILLNKN